MIINLWSRLLSEVPLTTTNEFLNWRNKHLQPALITDEYERYSKELPIPEQNGDRRNRLGSDVIQALECLKSWFGIQDFQGDDISATTVE
ncbi:hypothetical protein HRG_012761 [Hirsutella rhossiliensis]